MLYTRVQNRFSLACSLGLVESIPEDLPYPKGSPSHLSTYQAWMSLLSSATSSVDIASYYWTLIGRGDTKDPSDVEVHVHLGSVPSVTA